MFSPPSIHRRQRKRAQRDQDGTIESFTTILHPPAGFPARPRTIGLVALDDGSKVIGELILPQGAAPMIGQKVAPVMRHVQTTTEGLRVYDIAYEIAVRAKVERVFPGYIFAITGPSGVGKSTISSLLCKAAAEFTERVPIVTTRSAKEGDLDEYRYCTEEEFYAHQKNRGMAASTAISSTLESRHYGYLRSDIERIWKKGKIPVVVTERHLLQGLSSSFGRRSILSFGLLPPGRSKRMMLSSLLHRLRSRGRDSEEQIKERLQNASEDLQFFEDRKELFDEVLINEDLQSVVSILKGKVVKIASV